jgi:hypothetical protein
MSSGKTTLPVARLVGHSWWRSARMGKRGAMRWGRPFPQIDQKPGSGRVGQHLSVLCQHPEIPQRGKAVDSSGPGLHPDRFSGHWLAGQFQAQLMEHPGVPDLIHQTVADAHIIRMPAAGFLQEIAQAGKFEPLEAIRILDGYYERRRKPLNI